MNHNDILVMKDTFQWAFWANSRILAVSNKGAD